MKILHIIRRRDDEIFSQISAEIDRFNGAEQTLLMIQDGVYMDSAGRPAFACVDDVRARGIETSAELVNYDRIIEMVFDHDRVITW